MKRTKTLLLLLTISASSCNVAPSYLKADELTYQAVAPAHRIYLKADPNLTERQKERRLATLDSWAKRLAAAAAELNPR